MQIKNAAAGFIVAGALVAGVTACSSGVNSGVTYVYVPGYYGPGHIYHTYSTPHRVSISTYNSHKTYYAKPTKTYKAPSTTKVNKTPKKTSGGIFTAPSKPKVKSGGFGSSSRSRSGGFSRRR